MKEAKWIWKDGEFIAWKDATTHVLSHTLHYGNSVFEGVRAYPTPKGLAIFRLDLHTQRLLDSAKIVALQCPYSYEELFNAQIELLRKNEFSGENSIYIRPLIYLGYNGDIRIAHWHFPVNAIIAAWEWGRYLGDDALTQGIKVKISSFRRGSVNSTLNKAKAAGNYLNSQMAGYEAYQGGFDECLLLDEQGFVSEGVGECIFIVKNNELITPPNDYTLRSITQDSIIAIAKSLGIEVKQRHITRDEVYIADECFLVGTAAEVTPVREVDYRRIGVDNPITQVLQKKYFDVVSGKDAEFEHFLTYIKE